MRKHQGFNVSPCCWLWTIFPIYSHYYCQNSDLNILYIKNRGKSFSHLKYFNKHDTNITVRT